VAIAVHRRDGQTILKQNLIKNRFSKIFSYRIEQITCNFVAKFSLPPPMGIVILFGNTQYKQLGSTNKIVETAQRHKRNP
jgi:hypothetical protein